MLITPALFALNLACAAIEPVDRRAPAPASTASAHTSLESQLDPALRALLQQVRSLGLAGPRFGVLPQGLDLPAPDLAGVSICSITAALAGRAAMREAQEDLLLAIANCLNTLDPLDLAECLESLWDDYAEQIAQARRVFDARNDFCDLANESLYDPQIDPDDFLDPEDYADGGGNPFYPLEPGTTWIYEKLVDDELERITVTVEDDTRTLLGVECAVVRDTVEVFDLSEAGLEGEVVEDTFDYYAVDEELNVWYFGEDTWELEDGVIVNTNGRWLAGEDSAKPGIIMHASPIVGTVYRQEFALDEAEDVAVVISLDVKVKGPLGPFEHCRQTEDYALIEPGKSEYKFYAEGFGLVSERDPLEPDEALHLVEFYTRK